MKILLIEDDPETAAYIAASLGEIGYLFDHVADGLQGLRLASEGQYDVLVVDRMVPGLDGLSLVKALRAKGIATPALFLSALAGVDDRVSGLNAGGDDYLTKPFAFVELQARLAALGRRPAQSAQETVLRVQDMEMNLVTRAVRRAGGLIDLLPREWQLLEYLMRHAGQVVTKTMLLEQVWDFHFDPGTNVVETHISRLRQKVDRGFASELILTVRGAGYVIRADS